MKTTTQNNEETKETIPVPDLRILRTSDITPHEDSDTQRAAPLSTAIAREGQLRNPVIVTELSNESFMLLDGTNRHLAMSLLESDHIIAQVVAYPGDQVELLTWNHVLSNLAMDNLRAELSEKGIQTSSLTIADAKDKLEQAAIAAYIQTDTEHAIGVAAGDDWIQTLRTLVLTYMDLGQLNRTVFNDIEVVGETYPSIDGLVIFQDFTSQDVISITQNGNKIPAGVTRHLVAGRALRVNYSLDALRANQPIEEKTKQLTTWIQTKFAERSVRLYTEATYVFDE